MLRSSKSATSPEVINFGFRIESASKAAENELAI